MDKSRHITIFDDFGADIRFIKLPKVLYTSPLYRPILSNDAIQIWSFLRDRTELSRKNGWYDEDGRIYCRFSRQEFAELLNISTKTVSKARKQLMDAGLLEVAKQGYNKSDNLYINYPAVTKADIYKIEKLENPEYESELTEEEKSEKMRRVRNRKTKTDSESTSRENISPLVGSNDNNDLTSREISSPLVKPNGNTDLTSRENMTRPAGKNIPPNETYSNNLETNETNETGKTDLFTDNLAFRNQQKQLELEVVEQVFLRNHEDSFFEPMTLNKILMIANHNISDAENFLRISNNAKREVEKTLGEKMYLGSDYNPEIQRVANQIISFGIDQFIFRIKSGKLKDKFAYSYTLFVSVFIEIALFITTYHKHYDNLTFLQGQVILKNLNQLADKRNINMDQVIDRYNKISNQFTWNTEDESGQEREQ
ncbi:replication initiator protein A [Enterococcus sp. AZ196]|uniref:replication initiator protein A n=1 Tax=Enterococcus sp. AZ196 TaxID=2774659 RepID=UPI003D2E6E5C